MAGVAPIAGILGHVEELNEGIGGAIGQNEVITENWNALDNLQRMVGLGKTFKDLDKFVQSLATVKDMPVDAWGNVVQTATEIPNFATNKPMETIIVDNIPRPILTPQDYYLDGDEWSTNRYKYGPIMVGGKEMQGVFDLKHPELGWKPIEEEIIDLIPMENNKLNETSIDLINETTPKKEHTATKVIDSRGKRKYYMPKRSTGSLKQSLCNALKAREKTCKEELKRCKRELKSLKGRRRRRPATNAKKKTRRRNK